MTCITEERRNHFAWLCNPEVADMLRNDPKRDMQEIIEELAESYISVYTDDLIDFAVNHPDKVEAAWNNGDFCGLSFGDFTSYHELLAHAGQTAAIYANAEKMYDERPYAMAMAVYSELNECGYLAVSYATAQVIWEICDEYCYESLEYVLDRILSSPDFSV